MNICIQLSLQPLCWDHPRAFTFFPCKLQCLKIHPILNFWIPRVSQYIPTRIIHGLDNITVCWCDFGRPRFRSLVLKKNPRYHPNRGGLRRQHSQRRCSLTRDILLGTSKTQFLQLCGDLYSCSTLSDCLTKVVDYNSYSLSIHSR